MRFITYFHGLTPESLRPVRRLDRLPAWLPTGRTTLVPRASHALFLSWRALRLRKGHRVLCPAFTCNTVNRPLEKAGARTLFFNVRRDLTIDWPHVESLLAGPHRPRAMLWYHYLGLPLEFDRVRAFCREHDLLLIEDCAHALFSEHGGRPVGSFGDVAVFSLRKTLPVLLAGALVVNNPKLPRQVPVRWRRPTAGQLAFLHAREAYLHRVGLQAGDRSVAVERQLFRQTLRELERWFGDPSFMVRVDPLSRLVMHNAEPDSVRRARRRNFRAYRRELREIALVPRLPAGASPMGFAVRVTRRERLRRRLLDAGIESVPHWGRVLLPRGVARRFAAAAELADTELTLPCHQDLSPADVRYVCACLKRLA